MTMSFKNKENTIQVTICCPPASFTSGRKDACRFNSSADTFCNLSLCSHYHTDHRFCSGTKIIPERASVDT